MPLRLRQPGELNGRVAEPTPDVEHAISAFRTMVDERRVAVCLRVRDDDGLEALPDVEEGAVPGLGGLGILRCHGRRRHR
jgi:hypothetical protein